MDTIDLIEKLGIKRIADRYSATVPVSGGMGAKSFQGIDEHTGEKVFIKYLLFPVSSYEIAKFQSEIEVTKQVTSWKQVTPGCICAEYLHSETIYDGNVYCLITKWHSLPTLQEWLENNQNASIEERLELFHRVCNAISHIPTGIHHRDLHPGNILIEDIKIDWLQYVSNVGVRIIDWGNAIPEIFYGFDDSPDFVIELIEKAPKKIEGSYYSLPPEVFSPWENRRAQWGKYDAWPVALLMHKILTGKDVIVHQDLGSYIESLNNGVMENALKVGAKNILDIDFSASLLLSKVFGKLTALNTVTRRPLSYAGRIIWDIRIEKFNPTDLNEIHNYLQDPHSYEQIGGWKHSNIYDPE